MKYTKNTNHLISKYFFMCVCAIEIVFLLWRFVITPTRNSLTFIVTFIIILFLSLPLGLGVVLNIFKRKDVSNFFTFGLCIGYGLIAGVWALMIQFGCPLKPFLYIGIVFLIAVCLLYRKWYELKGLFTQHITIINLTKILAPVAVLLFAFIVISLAWLNSYVLTDVDCQSDSYNALMIMKEGSYPIVSPFLDHTRLQLNSGPVFYTVIAIISKLKNGILVKEIMAVTIISGAFLCMAMYFLASFVIRNEIILFFAGILILTRAYLSSFNDGNLPENIAFYYATLFIVFLIYTLEKKKRLCAVISGICLSLCMLSHPVIFLYNFPAFGLFFITFLVSTDKDLKKDYSNLFIILGIVLLSAIPYVIRLKESQNLGEMYENDATTLMNSLPYWNGYIVPALALFGIILIATRRKTINVYLWTYFLMVLVCVEHWRFYQIVSPSWFELKELAFPAFGAYYSYKVFRGDPPNYLSAWQAGVIIWPILIAVVIDFICNHIQRYINYLILKNILFFLIITLVFLFVGYEFKKAKRYPEFILKSDYFALKWLSENTPYGNTLIFSPFDNVNENAIPDYATSFWVPIVSERKSLPFRNYNISGQFKFLNMDKPITEKVSQLQKAAYSINDPQSYNIFKEMRITHIFVSGFLSGKLFNTYQNSPYVELIYYNTEPSSGTALVYKLK